jgi:hypothetical protein
VGVVVLTRSFSPNQWEKPRPPFALGVAALSQVARQLQSSWRLVHCVVAVSCGSRKFVLYE